MKKTQASHICPCGAHTNPGQILYRSPNRYVVLVQSADLDWLEVRIPLVAEATAESPVVCQEVLVYAVVMPSAEAAELAEPPRIIRPN